MKTILALALFASLAACATPPASIKASVASNCQPGDNARLRELVAVQNDMAGRDAMDTLLWGAPWRTIANKGQDHKAEIARLKACTGAK